MPSRGHLGILDFYYAPLRDIWDPRSDRPDGASDLDLLLYTSLAVKTTKRVEIPEATRGSITPDPFVTSERLININDLQTSIFWRR